MIFDYSYYVPYNQPPVGDYSLVVLGRGNEQNSSMENTDRLLMSYRRPAFKNKEESAFIEKKIGEVSYLLHAHTITLTNDDGTTGTMRSDYTAQHSFSFNKKDNIDIMFTGQIEWGLKAPSAQSVSPQLSEAQSVSPALPEGQLSEAQLVSPLKIVAEGRPYAAQGNLTPATAVPQQEGGIALEKEFTAVLQQNRILTNPEKWITKLVKVDTISAVSVLVNGKKINHGNNLATLKNDGDYRVKGVIEYYKF